MSSWFQIGVTVPAYQMDAASGLLFDLGSRGVQEEAESSDSQVRLTAYFSNSHSPVKIGEQLRVFLRGLDLHPTVEYENVPEQDWMSAWQSHFKPVYPTDRIAICPTWDVVDDPENGFTVIIEPKMAFGTGHHESTRLAIRHLERIVDSGDRVLDSGAGSAILSIVSAKLEADRVIGVEIDGQAIQNARENVRINGVSERVRLVHGSITAIQGAYDVVVSNMVSHLLIPLLPDLARRLTDSGKLILGGLLKIEEEKFQNALRASGLSVDDVDQNGEWIGFIVSRCGQGC